MNNKRGFTGFLSKVKCTPIPDPFFSVILPQIDDLAELKVTLYMFWAVHRKKGYPRFLTYSEMRGDRALISGMPCNNAPEEELRHGLKAAMDRGTLLNLQIERDSELEDLYFLNTEQDKRVVAKIQRGEIELNGLPRVKPDRADEEPNVFTLYEENIGLLSPAISEELKEAEELYPATWIEGAFKEAVRANRPNWQYVRKILERRASQEGSHGAVRGYSKKELRPEEYLQKYGHPTKR